MAFFNLLPAAGSTNAARLIPVAVAPDLTVQESDSSIVVSATVTITQNFQADQDVLSFTNTGQGNIVGVYDASTGVLQLTSNLATATLLQWQAALEAVTYQDTSATPNLAVRTVSFIASNGEFTSTVATRDVTIPAFVAPPTPITASPIPLYRFFDNQTGAHFYTTDANEKTTVSALGSLVHKPEFTPETNAFGAYSPSSSDTNQVSVYRFFDPANNAHFYTASAGERDAIMNPASPNYQAKWVYEPSATFYEHGAQGAGDVAVYRLFDTVLGAHFYTSDQSEIAGFAAKGSAAYQPNLISEGIAFYAPGGVFT